MGLLESVIGGLMGGSNNASSGMSGVLSDILGGGQAGGNQSGNVQGTAGGIGGLVSSFEKAGLGNVVQSWIGNGTNQSVSPSQLQNVFGDLIPGMAQKAGLPQGDFLSQLSQHLPNAVNGLTPNGQAQSEGSVNV